MKILILITTLIVIHLPAQGLEIEDAKIIDLSHAFDENTIYWPNSPIKFELKNLSYGFNKAGFFYSANSFCAPEHGGTHLDAPLHFGKDGLATSDVPLKKLIAPGVVIDVSAQAKKNHDYLVSLADVKGWEKKHGPIPEGALVLMRSDWSQFWPDRKRYLGDDRPGKTDDLHFPSFGLEAVEFLVDKRKIAGLGVDTASIDYGPSQDFKVHQFVAGKNLVALENLKDLGKLPPVGSWVVALPIKIKGGSGGPARVIAFTK